MKTFIIITFIIGILIPIIPKKRAEYTEIYVGENQAIQYEVIKKEIGK